MRIICNNVSTSQKEPSLQKPRLIPTTREQCEAPTIRLEALSNGNELFIWSARHWALAARTRQCIHRILYPRYAGINSIPAMHLVDECMCILAGLCPRPVDIRSPTDAVLSEDEHTVVRVLQALHHQQEIKADRVLMRIMPRPLNATFQRVAREYVTTLRHARLEFSSIRALNLIGGTS